MSFQNGNAHAKQGLARMKELGAEHQAKRQQLVAELLDGLGRKPRPFDRLIVENLAGLTVRANYLEERGRDASEIRREITSALLKVAKVPEPEAAS
jgi:hypothetical protein